MKRVRVLLIEDSLGDERLLLEGFKSMEYPCDFSVIRNGQEAYDFLMANRSEAEKLPDLIVSDIGLPRLNGVELLKALKLDEVLGRIPFVLLSGSSETNISWNKIETVPDLFMEKPFGIDEMEVAVGNIWNFWLTATDKSKLSAEKSEEV